MLALKDFRSLTLKDKPLFDALQARYPAVHSDELFTTMISWMAYSRYKIAQVDDNIVVMTSINGQRRFRPPLGERNPELLRQVLQLAAKTESDYPFGVINEETRQWIAGEFPRMRFSTHRDYFDYVYRAADLADLSGPAYTKIRNRLNKFTRNYEYTIEPIAPDTMEDARRFLHRWCLWRDCDSDKILMHEKKAILYSMNYFEALGLSGLMMRIRGKVEALAVYERLNADTAVVHYEKASPFMDGIYKAINKETAERLQNAFTYINREEDLGIPGLRKAKMSYRPHHMIKVYHVRKEDIRQ